MTRMTTTALLLASTLAFVLPASAQTPPADSPQGASQGVQGQPAQGMAGMQGQPAQSQAGTQSQTPGEGMGGGQGRMGMMGGGQGGMGMMGGKGGMGMMGGHQGGMQDESGGTSSTTSPQPNPAGATGQR